ncbi:Serine carboxypeptidase-like 14 [Acorus calamus]|uniref:Serine carboxypeptidase-like 14 n=1 Tax=Acorus calamus TaxID=4465 RepID=A0AAV9EG82_ACOCL|nr:Serine carboxypeptidase-like 14 [Acorus calamus]
MGGRLSARKTHHPHPDRVTSSYSHPPLQPQPPPPPPTHHPFMAALPYSRADESLRSLAGHAEGFGRHAIGGLHGAVYHVTSLAGGRGHDVDGIQIKPKSRHIWIDRCSLRDYDDGLIDITRESTDITVSRCHFSMHDKTMLIGADATHIGDRCIRVTIHHCFFDGTRQRHPRVRYGKVHLYNNYTRNWGIYAVCASVESQILSQYNMYEAGQKKAVYKYLTEKTTDREEAGRGYIRSEGDLFLNGAQHCLIEESDLAEEYYPTWTMEPPSDALKEILQICTGWQAVPRPSDCVSQPKSERRPEEDPLLTWISGGPGCSSFFGLAFEIGPLHFDIKKYDGEIPNLVLHPYSWTKVSNILFIDIPIGAGFSFARGSEPYMGGDIKSSKQVYKFIRKWLDEHPQFLLNPLYIGGDSYSGKLIPVITNEVIEDIEAGLAPPLNLKKKKVSMEAEFP